VSKFLNSVNLTCDNYIILNLIMKKYVKSNENISKQLLGPIFLFNWVYYYINNIITIIYIIYIVIVIIKKYYFFLFSKNLYKLFGILIKINIYLFIH